MKYDNLLALINESNSSRRFFLSLPVDMQMALHEQNDFIHTAHELHRHVDAIKEYQKLINLGG